MSTTEPDGTETGGIEFTCARCGHDGLAVVGDARVTCPSCSTTFAVRVADGFALLERDGWTVTVSLDVPDGLATPDPGDGPV